MLTGENKTEQTRRECEENTHIIQLSDKNTECYCLTSVIPTKQSSGRKELKIYERKIIFFKYYIFPIKTVLRKAEQTQYFICDHKLPNKFWATDVNCSLLGVRFHGHTHILSTSCCRRVKRRPIHWRI